jgi:hypothetical protein
MTGTQRELKGHYNRPAEYSIFLIVQNCCVLALCARFGGAMETEKPTWQQLCETAALEEDPKKLRELIAEINRDLKEKEDQRDKLRA